MKTIFISYSHDDTSVKDALLKELKYMERAVGGILWHDGLIKPGVNWKQEIVEQLDRADAAIFLVSARFLASGFCQDVEVRRLMERHKRERTPLFLFLVSDSALELYPELSEIEVLPKGKDLRPKPWNACDAAARSRACTKLVRTLVEHFGSPGIGLDVRKLITINGRELAARKEADNFSNSPGRAEESLRRITEACLVLHGMRWYDEARHLVKCFKKRLKAANTKLAEPLYRDIIGLLETGLPEHPVHMDCIPQVTVDTLFSNPDCAALLKGIRLTETDHDKVIDFFERREWKSLKECPLLAYARAQCYRKVGQLEEAEGRLDRTRSLLEGIGNKPCLCGLGCLRADLMVEAYRGLGAACRKNESFPEAERCFSEGEKLLPGASPRVAGDFFFSYGYFEFERAYKFRFLKTPRIKERAYVTALLRAERLYKRSVEHSKSASAAIARLPIIHSLLGKSSKAVREFVEGETASKSAGGMEATLSAINCRFAILLEAFRRSRANAVENPASEKIFNALEKLFRSAFIPVGPRQCHAFDNAVILHGPEGPPTADAFRKAQSVSGRCFKKEEVWLWRTYALLQDALKWECSTKKQQIDKLRQWCKRMSLRSVSR